VRRMGMWSKLISWSRKEVNEGPVKVSDNTVVGRATRGGAVGGGLTRPAVVLETR
jgi:hypothetical protein